jgi:undecaprenyl-diphosphatase
VPTLEDAPFLSFPSGHTVYALVAWGFVAYIIARRPQTSLGLRVLLLLLVLTIAGLVGASRIYLAAHYPSDVAGGLLMAIPWLIVVVFMYERRGDKRGGSMKRST